LDAAFAGCSAELTNVGTHGEVFAPRTAQDDRTDLLVSIDPFDRALERVNQSHP
jgi:hypothetical protein